MTKKRALFVIALIFIILLAVFIRAIYLSFSVVRPTTEQINKKLTSLVLSKIIRIPEGIQRPSYEFERVRYFWEMETNAKEVTAVNFTYTPSYTRDEKEITATLEMPEKGDPSIFTKVLPAVISDDQSLKSAQDPDKANISANEQSGYTKLALEKDPKNNQTTKITWTFEKSKLPQEIMTLYTKINYPPKILKFLDSIPSFLINLARG